MKNDFKLVFTTGAPGSMWSAISYRFKKSLKGFDFTDETESRRYALPKEHKLKLGSNLEHSQKTYTHVGSYFGPFHEFGNCFDDLNVYQNVEDFYEECLKPFNNDEAKFKMIKSHWFSYNLDWIWKNCKGHKILLVWREPKAAEKWWYSMGGWSINYPVYTWYDNPNRMREKIKEENDLITKFAQQHNIKWWNFETHDKWLNSRLPEANIIKAKTIPMLEDVIKVAYFDIT